MSSTNDRYLRWLAQRWDAHKSESFYSSTERENQRTEEVLDMLEGIRELSKRSVGSTRARATRRETRTIADNKKRRMGGSEGRRHYYKSVTREEARKEEVLEIFSGLSALARQHFKVY